MSHLQNKTKRKSRISLGTKDPSNPRLLDLRTNETRSNKSFEKNLISLRNKENWTGDIPTRIFITIGT